MLRPERDASGAGTVDERVLAEVEQNGRHARFISDLLRSVSRSGALSRPEVEQALTTLEDEGKLLVREHYCGDPHLEGVDLRIAGSVRSERDGDDPIAACVNEIEAIWQDWITAYLAEHRCS